MKATQTRFYKVECPRREDRRILGDMIQFVGDANIGLVGSGLNALCYSENHIVYFSYSPGQVSHPSVIEETPEALIEKFEARLKESGLRWTTFDLGKLLETVRV
jgi:hypothetical protein